MASDSLVIAGIVMMGGFSFLFMLLIVLLDFKIGKKAEMKNRRYY
jgi:hypothetical protein